MTTLFISTYTNKLTIGLLTNGKVISLKEINSIKSHSIYLIPTIKDILAENKLDIKEIKEIIVINGPGSFTGVRLGIIVAKTMAYTLNIPIKTITSIDALAISNDDLKEKIITIKDTKGLYFGIYKDNKRISDLLYLNNEDFNSKYYHKNIINSDKLNLEKIYNYLKSKNNINPHEVNPVYIKIIDVLK